MSDSGRPPKRPRLWAMFGTPAKRRKRPEPRNVPFMEPPTQPIPPHPFLLPTAWQQPVPSTPMIQQAPETDIEMPRITYHTFSIYVETQYLTTEEDRKLHHIFMRFNNGTSRIQRRIAADWYTNHPYPPDSWMGQRTPPMSLMFDFIGMNNRRATFTSVEPITAFNLWRSIRRSINNAGINPHHIVKILIKPIGIAWHKTSDRWDRMGY